jgi:anti-sigma factor RsiW
MVDEEKFFAWLDGELSPDEAARVEAEVAADPEWSKLAAEHRSMTAGLRGAFGAVETRPVPERLQVMLKGDGNVVSLADARSRRQAGRFGSRPPPLRRLSPSAFSLVANSLAVRAARSSPGPAGSLLRPASIKRFRRNSPARLRLPDHVSA